MTYGGVGGVQTGDPETKGQGSPEPEKSYFLQPPFYTCFNCTPTAVGGLIVPRRASLQAVAMRLPEGKGLCLSLQLSTPEAAACPQRAGRALPPSLADPLQAT